MSTRGPRRWCPLCKGQVYFHHAAADGGDVYYCQNCGKEISEAKVLKIDPNPDSIPTPTAARPPAAAAPKK